MPETVTPVTFTLHSVHTVISADPEVQGAGRRGVEYLGPHRLPAFDDRLPGKPPAIAVSGGDHREIRMHRVYERHRGGRQTAMVWDNDYVGGQWRTRPDEVTL